MLAYMQDNTPRSILPPPTSALQKAAREFLRMTFPDPANPEGDSLTLMQMVNEGIVPLMSEVRESQNMDRDAAITLPALLLTVQRIAFAGTELESIYGKQQATDGVALAQGFREACAALNSIAKAAPEESSLKKLEDVARGLTTSYDTTIGKATNSRASARR